jgi:hypothetical protein
MTPDGQKHRRRLELAAHNNLVSWAGKLEALTLPVKRDWAWHPKATVIALKKIHEHEAEGEGLDNGQNRVA